MKERVRELIENFNNEFPNGDTYELALYIYQKAQEDTKPKKMELRELDAERDGYVLRYFFNAGLDRKTLMCDAEGTEVYEDEKHIGTIYNVTPRELCEMTEDEFYVTFAENGVDY